MIISSTQFQQNVGYYLNQAENGEEIVIEKLRPKGISFKLIVNGNNQKEEQEKRLSEARDKLKQAHSIKNKFLHTDPVKYQRWTRSR